MKSKDYCRRFHKFINEENSKAFKLCLKVAQETAGIIKVSHKGVPYVIFKTPIVTYSACYFVSTRHWKIFYPYGRFEEPQKIINCKEFTDVIRVMREIAPEWVMSEEDYNRLSRSHENESLIYFDNLEEKLSVFFEPSERSFFELPGS